MTEQTPRVGYSALQRRLWRWHFAAGLLLAPFAIILSLTGAVYLFKPQYQHWVEQQISAKTTVSTPTNTSHPAFVDDWVNAAKQSFPESTLIRVVLPKHADDLNAEVELKTNQGGQTVWVDARTATVLHQQRTNTRLMHFIKDIHGNLLNGKVGSLLVEMAAHWLIALILLGFVLWWPRSQPWWRMFLPKARANNPREKLRAVHGALGAWCGAFILLWLVSGLPWTQVWGGAFKEVTKALGAPAPTQEWVVTLQSSTPNIKTDGLNAWSINDDDGGAVSLRSSEPSAPTSHIGMQWVANQSEVQRMKPPVWLQPPRGDNGVWTVRSMTPNRPQRQTIHYDQWTGDVVMRIGFEDYAWPKKITSFGISIHEGALFGWLNQLLGVIIALSLTALSALGLLTWWKRRPKGKLGLPTRPVNHRLSAAMWAGIISLGMLLPLMGVSVLLMGSVAWMLGQLDHPRQ